MQIAQIVLPDATEYERKSQTIDHQAIAAQHEVVVTDSPAGAGDAQVAHVYGPLSLPGHRFRKFGIPYVASAPLAVGPFRWRRPPQPEYIVSPLKHGNGDAHYQLLPEAVGHEYFLPQTDDASRREKRIGTFGPSRKGIVAILEQSLVRIQRVREDVTWELFDRVPTAADLAGVDVWVDPATEANDFDGFVAEALAAGKAVVASRTAINEQRLEKGRSGLIVPPGDPNELTHAILAALFKPEIIQPKRDAAQQTINRFHPRQRIRVLTHIYQTLTT